MNAKKILSLFLLLMFFTFAAYGNPSMQDFYETIDDNGGGGNGGDFGDSIFEKIGLIFALILILASRNIRS